VEEATISSAKGGITVTKTTSPEKTTTLTPEVIFTEDSVRGRDYPVISIDNVTDLVLQKTIHPFFPEVVHIASNGRIAAVGNLSGIRIIDLDSGSVLMQMDGTFPDCNFGMDRYFQLNLAESGMRFSAAGVDSYFRVVDIKKNLTVYEWDGKNESPNGHFYTFPNLGFSSDGKILQTFDRIGGRLPPIRKQ